ncbi:formylmethionine deformylase [Anaerotruncus colihominis]|uniref:Peptide deformylase n=1 Tax=Anaerotruncus colihominis TaxID=169435 RepID=A0A1Y4MTH0_9FIRM|nr:peptide deformylase [Anaerotruncus colihominis]NBI78662.1 peptide deformylase [Anaerotruncus colihominis]OUP69764.1 formylmethionine deformylase [Anaerotruncus colihominis]OUP72003.1 formylmethionine deformylase [Anaerotruncus colihominis]
MVREILRLGNPALYEKSAPVTNDELERMRAVAVDLRDTLLDYRKRHQAGRAIAAPQIGVQKRMIYLQTDQTIVLINPVLSFPDGEQMEVLDDCMSFPGLLVRVMRFKRCTVRFRDLEWNEQKLYFEGDLAELLQHEYDHLDGMLATMRAVDNRSFFFV